MTLTDGEVEVGWSPTSKPHVIEKYPSGKPKAACGVVLSGLADQYHVRAGELRDDVCQSCKHSRHVRQHGG